jgi:hypothetical protein
MKRRQKTERQIQLVALDVDGTLLDSHNRLSPGLRDALAAVRRKGIGVTLISGRGRALLEPLVHLLHIEPPYAFSGGAGIAKLGLDRPLAHTQLEPAAVEAIVLEARARGLGLVAHVSDRLLCEVDDETWSTIQEWQWLAGKDGLIKQRVRDVLECQWERPDRLDVRCAPHTRENLQLEFAKRIPSAVGHFGPWHVEITPRECQKDTALRIITDYLQIPIEATLAIGNGVNDAHLFQAAGLSVAVANADPRLKELADWVTKTNDEGGVAEVLHDLSRRDGVAPAPRHRER